MLFHFYFFCRESPECIQGFSRDWLQPTIYIRTPEGQETSARQFVNEKIIKPNPQMKLVNFEYSVQQHSAKYVMQGNNDESDEQQPKSGSVVYKTGTLKKELLTKQTTINIGPTDNPNYCNNHLPGGTLSCFMFRHCIINNGDKRVSKVVKDHHYDSPVWGISAGHIFLHSNTSAKPAGREFVFSECNSTRGSSKPQILAESYEASLGHLETSHGFSMVDVCIFPLCADTLSSRKYDLTINGLRRAPDVFCGQDIFLERRRVYKIGKIS